MSIWNTLEKMTYTGLGLASLTKDKIDETVENLKKEHGLNEAEGRKLAEELKENVAKAGRDLDERIHTAVSGALKSMKLVRQKEVDELKSRIEELEKASKFSKDSETEE